MNELEKLRPEVREAIGYCDDIFDDADNGEWGIVRAELLRLTDEYAALKAQSIYPRAQLLGNLADANERAEKAGAELVAIKDENVKLRDVLADRDMDREMAAHANKELAALKARIAEAPIGMVMGGAESNQDNTDSYRVDVPIGWESSLADKRVRLVVEG